MLIFNKNIGETSLEALERARFLNAIPSDVKMTYAGTLDPMAEGVLILLTGAECKNKDLYTGLKKEYEVEILLGVSTDTDDILGLIEEVFTGTNIETEIFSDSNFWSQFIGGRAEEYHPFSHKKIDGVPLFEYAKNKNLDGVVIPSKDVNTFSVELVGFNEYTKEEIENLILARLSLVMGDFRQAEIISRWKDFFETTKSNVFKSVCIKVSCGPGVYMRSLVRKIATQIDAPALALNIKRTKVGGYEI